MTSQHALVHLAPQPDCPASDLVDQAEDALWALPGGWEQVLITTQRRYAEYFPLRSGADADHPQLIRTGEGATTHCAGGPIGLLDLHARRIQAADSAACLYDAWTQAVAAMPPVRSLADFLAASDSSSALARITFREQTHIKIADSLAEAQLSRTDKEALATLDRDAFVERARAQAVTADSLLQLDGPRLIRPTWADSQAPDTAAAEYHQRVNAYLDSLPEDHVIVGADFIR
ncbi:hypothetical protein ACIBBE_24510 [Streptomyces sp. NPDC051644]|uniref:hypothetical protein n=1 Tax=Streptomyces sp. NPDC051644 TaxID=3365666 RepID=UPI0037BA8657